MGILAWRWRIGRLSSLVSSSKNVEACLVLPKSMEDTLMRSLGACHPLAAWREGSREVVKMGQSLPVPFIEHHLCIKLPSEPSPFTIPHVYSLCSRHLSFANRLHALQKQSPWHPVRQMQRSLLPSLFLLSSFPIQFLHCAFWGPIVYCDVNMHHVSCNFTLCYRVHADCKTDAGLSRGYSALNSSGFYVFLKLENVLGRR